MLDVGAKLVFALRGLQKGRRRASPLQLHQHHQSAEQRFIPVIAVSELTKVYGQTLAVDRVSFEVEKGTIVGFLGPNGAGKSTTLKILTCYLPPTSGGASINGFDIFKQSEQVRENLG